MKNILYIIYSLLILLAPFGMIYSFILMQDNSNDSIGQIVFSFSFLVMLIACLEQTRTFYRYIRNEK